MMLGQDRPAAEAFRNFADPSLSQRVHGEEERTVFAVALVEDQPVELQTATHGVAYQAHALTVFGRYIPAENCAIPVK